MPCGTSLEMTHGMNPEVTSGAKMASHVPLAASLSRDLGFQLIWLRDADIGVRSRLPEELDTTQRDIDPLNNLTQTVFHFGRLGGT